MVWDRLTESRVGRIRLSLLWRSVETRLPPNMLGWDVGTFEFSKDQIVARDFMHEAKLKLRTGGSSGKVPRSHCHKSEGGVSWDVSVGENASRLPVKFRYRSPVIFEFHTAGKRGAAAYAVLWLHHLVDNNPTDFDLPIWTTKMGHRLIQNYSECLPVPEACRRAAIDTTQSRRETGARRKCLGWKT